MSSTVVNTYASTLPTDDAHPYRTGAWQPNHREWDAFDLEVEGEIPADIVYEDEHCLAFRDINPQAPKPNEPGSSFLQLIRKKEKTFSVVQLETNNYFTVAQNDTIQFACWIQSKFKKFNNIEVIYFFNEI